MEWVIAIVVIIAIVVCVVKSKNAGQNNINSPYVSGTPFNILVNTETRNIQGTSLEIFVVKGRGKITAPFPNYPAFFITTIIDETDGDKKPVISTVEQYRIKNNMFFTHTSGIVNLPYAQSEFAKWIDLVLVPVDVLVFPKTGMRKLKFEVTVGGIQTLTKASQTINYNNLKPGYEELVENIEKTENMTVKAAIQMCGIDGDFDDNETKIVMDWIVKKAVNINGSVNQAKKTRLIEILNDTVKEIKEKGAADLTQTCDEINKAATTAYKYEIIDLLIKITSADGVYKKEEQNLINEIASKIDVNMERVRTMIDKQVDVKIYEGETDIDSQLGLKDSMTVEEKKKQLRDEYRKWNQQAASSNEKIRNQANEMLEIIAKKRSELK